MWKKSPGYERFLRSQNQKFHYPSKEGETGHHFQEKWSYNKPGWAKSAKEQIWNWRQGKMTLARHHHTGPGNRVTAWYKNYDIDDMGAWYHDLDYTYIMDTNPELGLQDKPYNDWNWSDENLMLYLDTFSGMGYPNDRYIPRDPDGHKREDEFHSWWDEQHDSIHLFSTQLAMGSWKKTFNEVLHYAMGERQRQTTELMVGKPKWHEIEKHFQTKVWLNADGKPEVEPTTGRQKTWWTALDMKNSGYKEWYYAFTNDQRLLRDGKIDKGENPAFEQLISENAEKLYGVQEDIDYLIENPLPKDTTEHSGKQVLVNLPKMAEPKPWQRQRGFHPLSQQHVKDYAKMSNVSIRRRTKYDPRWQTYFALLKEMDIDKDAHNDIARAPAVYEDPNDALGELGLAASGNNAISRDGKLWVFQKGSSTPEAMTISQYKAFLAKKGNKLPGYGLGQPGFGKHPAGVQAEYDANWKKATDNYRTMKEVISKQPSKQLQPPRPMEPSIEEGSKKRKKTDTENDQGVERPLKGVAQQGYGTHDPRISLWDVAGHPSFKAQLNKDWDEYEFNELDREDAEHILSRALDAEMDSRYKSYDDVPEKYLHQFFGYYKSKGEDARLNRKQWEAVLKQYRNTREVGKKQLTIQQIEDNGTKQQREELMQLVADEKGYEERIHDAYVAQGRKPDEFKFGVAQPLTGHGRQKKRLRENENRKAQASGYSKGGQNEQKPIQQAPAPKKPRGNIKVPAHAPAPGVAGRRKVKPKPIKENSLKGADLKFGATLGNPFRMGIYELKWAYVPHQVSGYGISNEWIPLNEGLG